MTDVHKFSEHVIDLAKRLANIADAAQGRNRRGCRPRVRWLLLPAAGAGIYALATGGAFKREADIVVTEAKGRASEFPEALLSRINEAAGLANGPSNRPESPPQTTNRRTTRRSKSKARA